MGVFRYKALISSPLPQLWDFVIRPENMHLWGPLTQPITDLDHPMQAGDRLTQHRSDFFRKRSRVLLVDEVVPQQSITFRVLAADGRQLDVRATVSLDAAADKEETWIEEAIFYSLGSGRAAGWLDRWVVNPLIQLAVTHKTKKAFRRLEGLVGRAAKTSAR